MPIDSNQTVGSLTYPRPRQSVTVDTTLESYYSIVSSDPNSTTEEWYVNLDPDNTTRQVDTITLSAGSTADVYSISIDDGTTDKTYTYLQAAGDVDADIATNLGELLDLHPGISAAVATNVITVTGVVAGTAITIAVEAATTTPGNAVVANTTAAAGTPLFTKIADIVVSKKLTTDNVNKGFPKMESQATFYDGDVTTPVVIGVPQVTSATGSKSLDAIQTENGVANPV